MIKIGQEAIDFTLKDQNGSDLHLDDLRGKKVILSFHPLAWTPVCTSQMKALEENFDRIKSLNAVPVGISIDSVPCKAAWAKELGIKRLRMVSDFWPHGLLAISYDLFRDKEGFAERANVILNEHHHVVWTKLYRPLRTVPDIEEVIASLWTVEKETSPTPS
jgi:peroxiredoxin